MDAVLGMFTNVSHFTSSAVLRWSSSQARPVVGVCGIIVALSQASYFYADVVFLSHQCCQQVVKCMHVMTPVHCSYSMEKRDARNEA